MRLSTEQIQAALDDVHVLVERELARRDGAVDVVMSVEKKIDKGNAYRVAAALDAEISGAA